MGAKKKGSGGHTRLYENRAMHLPCSGSFGERHLFLPWKVKGGRVSSPTPNYLLKLHFPEGQEGEGASGLERAWLGPASSYTMFHLLLATLIPPGGSPACQSTAFPAPGREGLSAAGQRGHWQGKRFTCLQDHGAICLSFLWPARTVKSKTYPRIKRDMWASPSGT